MLRIITYMLVFYIPLKGIEIFQIAAASSRQNCTGIITWGVVVLLACRTAVIGFVVMQENMATSVASGIHVLG